MQGNKHENNESDSDMWKKPQVTKEEFVDFFANNADEFGFDVLSDNTSNKCVIALHMKKDQNNLTSHDILEYIYDHLNENGNFKHESNCDSETLKTTTKL